MKRQVANRVDWSATEVKSERKTSAIIIHPRIELEFRWSLSTRVCARRLAVRVLQIRRTSATDIFTRETLSIRREVFSHQGCMRARLGDRHK